MNQLIVDGVVGNEAGDRIDPVLGQTETGFEANDRKRQVELRACM